MASTKRSLFSKPSWATSTSVPSTIKADDETIFGRHGGVIYEDIVADELKRKERRAAKTRAKAKASEGEGREPKRRRISEEDGDNSDAGSNAEENVAVQGNEKKARPVRRSTPTKTKFAPSLDSPLKPTTVTAPRQAKVQHVSLKDADDDLQITGATTVSHATKEATPKKPAGDEYQSEPDSEDDDPYFQSLKLRARQELAMKKAEQAKNVLALKEAEMARNAAADPSTSMTEHSEDVRESPVAPEVPPQKDEGPSVGIYITSIYPHTKPLIIRQPASRSLKKVKEIWCQKQGFDEAKTKDFFLTWNGARLFDSSNLMTALDALKRQRPGEEDPSGGNIHLEAMEPKIFEHRRQQKEREEAEAAGLDKQNVSESVVEEPAERKFVISLQAKDRKPFQLSVRPSTQIGKIMAGYHKTVGLEEGQVGWLLFDGVRLDPGSTVQDAEIEQDDVVEVHIR